MISVIYSISAEPKREIKLPFWADHVGTGPLAASAICETVFARAKWIEKSSVVVEIHSPEIIAGTYDVELERALQVNAKKRAA
jgi:hypothetical protein